MVHKSKVVGDLKTGYFGFMQLLDWTHPWAPRGPGSLGKILRFQVCYIKTRNRASVHISYVVGDLSIAVILKLREGMHFSRSKNVRLLNYFWRIDVFRVFDELTFDESVFDELTKHPTLHLNSINDGVSL